MKKLMIMLLTLLLLLPPLNALGDGTIPTLPEEIANALAAERWEGWVVEDALLPGGDEAIVLMRKSPERRLIRFRFGVENWVQAWVTDAPLPVTENPLCLTDLSGSQVQGLSLQCAFSIREDIPGGWQSIWELEGSSWQLRMLLCQDTDGGVIESFRIQPGRVTYNGWRKNGPQRIYGTLQTDLRYFSWPDFDRDPDKLRQSLTTPPDIPHGTLSATPVRFSGGRKYPVYQGPGPDYGQAAGGRAMVSTNDWIQVFGVEDGYAMIQYDITRDHMRIGWIDASALPVTASVPALRFNPVSAWTTTTVTLTDDPLHSGSAIITLPQGVWVTRLAVMGDWAYVESSTGDLLRGFVPLSALTEDQVCHLESCPWDDGRAPLRGTLSFVSGGVQLEITGCDTTLLGGMPTGFAVYDTQTRALLLTMKGSQLPLRGQCTTQADSLLICPIGPGGMADMTRAVRVER